MCIRYEGEVRNGRNTTVAEAEVAVAAVLAKDSLERERAGAFRLIKLGLMGVEGTSSCSGEYVWIYRLDSKMAMTAFGHIKEELPELARRMSRCGLSFFLTLGSKMVVVSETVRK